ncbi:uncharacterized protein LOC120333366 [Styela clava]|uniref:uncharacterized protein LOC120333366 n=1 Tax=Styela clava TaxID=7725 RepID=UPI00193951A4|nr:uncharacterized protein LOC120333366 [Styela clava]
MSTRIQQKQKEPTTSLLDSVFYQSALRVNRLEDNKLKKIQLKIENDFERQFNYHNTASTNAYDWAMNMRQTTGRTYRSNPARMRNIQSRPKTVPETRPTCCVMYGMIMGERPVLLKHFLGRKAKKRKVENGNENENESKAMEGHRNVTSAPIGEKRVQTPLTRVSISQNKNRRHEVVKPTLSKSLLIEEAEEYKTFMYDNKLVTQVPIGYSRSSSRPHTSFVSHTSEMLRPENTKVPNYYTLRYKYVLPPICMFR